jgi:cell wall-associated NlpC family hydrolase
MPRDPHALIGTLQKAGFKGEGLRTAFGISMRESGGRPDAYNPNRDTGDDSYGLFQINMLGNMGPARRKQFGLQDNKELLDPLVNAKAAYRMSRGGQDFGAWGIGPNAYRQGAGMETIKKYYDQFPALLKSQHSPKVVAMSQQAARNQIQTQKEIKDPGYVGAMSAHITQMYAGQEEIIDEVTQYMSRQAMVNQRINEAGPSQTTLGLLQAMGGTSAKVAESASKAVPLPQFPSFLYTPKSPAPDVEAATNAQWGGSLKPPISSKTGNVPGVSDPTTSKSMQRVLAIAHDQIGTPYVWGASSPKAGFDCSGLIEYAFEQAGIRTPGRLTTQSMMKLGKSVKKEQYRPGDWVITNGGKHVVMYVGKGKVIAAPHTGEVVQYQDLSRFKGDIVDVRRFA